MAKTEHVHKLRRHKYPNGTKVYFCVLDCNYKIEAAFVIGKKTICNICGEEFHMNEYSAKLAKPHCTKCGKIQIVDEDGNKRRIDKSRPVAAIADLSNKNVNSLRERLGKVIQMERDPEDI
jgi:ribosomal protein S27AE